MLKKKNIAMMMAVATAATTAAPAFAAVQSQNVDEATMIAEVQKMLDTKYFDQEDSEDGSVYKIEVVEGSTVKSEIKTIKALKAAIANAKIEDKELTLKVTDKGHTVVDGRIVNTVNAKYELYSDLKTDIDDAVTTLTSKVVRNVVYYDADGNIVESDAAEAIITLVNGKEIKLSVGDKKLNFEKALDANGNVVALPVATTEIGKQIVGFETLENKVEAPITIPSKQLDSLVFNAKDVSKVELNLSDLYTENGYTKEGLKLVNTLTDANSNGGNTTAINTGKEYSIAFNKDDLEAIKVNKDGKYELTIELKVKEVNSKDDAVDVKVVVTSTSHKDLTQVLADVKTNTTFEEGKGKYTTLAGENRFETAVEISKEAYVKYDSTKSNKAKAVVLVGQDAIVDGLAAAPLAKQKTAPILLTQKDAVPAETMSEIKRLIEKNPTIYIVGGENTISKDVEAALIKETNAKIVRLAGDDRYDTSVKIAKEMKKVTDSVIKEAFVVGGEGEADAMSIAAVAAKITEEAATGSEVAPILVTPQNGLTQGGKDLLYVNKTNITNVDVIGGTSKISKQVIKDIEANVDTTKVTAVERVSGEDRQETNAKVINKYYTGEVAGVFVAKDGYVGGNGQLIDALAVAPLAGKNKAPIVLGTNDLTEEQVKAIEDNATTVSGSDKHSMFRVGNGIAETVIQKIMKKLSL